MYNNVYSNSQKSQYYSSSKTMFDDLNSSPNILWQLLYYKETLPYHSLRSKAVVKIMTFKDLRNHLISDESKNGLKQ